MGAATAPPVRARRSRRTCGWGHLTRRDDELWSALSAASLDRRVAALPDQLDTRLGERGGGVSAGEARRVTIAHALLRPTSLLLLDEPTAHLDGDTEAARDLVAATRGAVAGRWSSSRTDRRCSRSSTTSCHSSPRPCCDDPRINHDTIRLARPATRRLVLSTLLGAACIASAIGLLGTSAWLISRCRASAGRSPTSASPWSACGSSPRPRPVPLRRAARRSRRSVPSPHGPPRHGVRAARAHHPLGAALLSSRRPARPRGRGRRCPSGRRPPRPAGLVHRRRRRCRDHDRALDHAAGRRGRRGDRFLPVRSCRGAVGVAGVGPTQRSPPRARSRRDSLRQWSTCSRALPTSWHSARWTAQVRRVVEHDREFTR